MQSLVALHIIRNKREGRVVWAFFLLSSAIIFWQIIYIFQSNAIYAASLDVQSGAIAVPNPDIGFGHPIAVFDRLQYFAIGLIAPSFLYLVLSMFVGLEEKKDKILRIVLFSFPVILYMLNGYSIATSTPMIHLEYKFNSEGLYATTRGPTYWFNVAYGYTFIGLGFLLLIFKSIKPSYILQRKQALVFLGGTVLALFGNIQAVFIPTSLNYDMTPVLMTVGSIFFALGLLKYKMFLIEPSTEKALEGEASFDLTMGHGFVVYEDTPEYALEIFADMAKHSMQGLAFVPADPSEVRENHELLKTPILQVGDKSTPSILSYYSEDERDYMLYMANRFSKDAPNTIILISGITKFASSMPGEAASMLGSIADIASNNSSRLLVSLPRNAAKDDVEKVLAGFMEL